jgi:hypothetical protein
LPGYQTHKDGRCWRGKDREKVLLPSQSLWINRILWIYRFKATAFWAWFKQVRVTLFVVSQGVAASNPKDLWMVAPLLEFCHPQAALEAATQN